MDKNSLFKQYKTLKQFKDLPDEEIWKVVEEKIERNEILGSLKYCINEEEKKFAQELLEKYLSSKSFENPAERDTLRNLIDFEVILDRVKIYINQETQKANPVPPVQMIDQLQKFNEHIEDLKEKLSLTQKEDQKTILDEWVKLKNKALAYYKESAGCNVVKCPECKKTFMLLKDLKNYTAENIPMFKKTMLYNRKLFELYGQGRVTKEEISAILGVSPDYIDFIYENEYKNDK